MVMVNVVGYFKYSFENILISRNGLLGNMIVEVIVRKMRAIIDPQEQRLTY